MATKKQKNLSAEAEPKPKEPEEPKAPPAVTDYAPPDMSEILHDNGAIAAQYAQMQAELSEELETWKASNERAKLTSQKQTVSSALGGVSFLRHIANARSYYLTAICHDKNKLLLALDEYAECCLQLGILPSKESLCLWLHTSIASLAFVRNDNGAHFEQEIVDIISQFENYILSTWVQFAALSQKPPVFSIFYLKAAYGYTEAAQNVNINVQNGILTDDIRYRSRAEKLLNDVEYIDIEPENTPKT